jgi:hypothetical protein
MGVYFVPKPKVVEEASFGQTSRLADVLNPRGRKSLNADHPDRSLQEFGFRFVSHLGYRHFGTNQWASVCTTPIGWYADQDESLLTGITLLGGTHRFGDFSC